MGGERRSIAWAAALALTSSGMLAACAVPRPGAATVADRYQGPIGSDDIARGRSRYEVVCAPCHGDHAERQGPLLARLEWTPPEIRHQVREGSALMPPIRQSRLSDRDLEALLRFFLTTGACVQEEQEFARYVMEEGSGEAECECERRCGDEGEAETEAETVTVTESETESETEVETETEAEPEPEPESGTVSETGTVSGTVSEAGTVSE